MDMDMDYLFITPTYDHKIYDHDHGSVQNYTTLLGDDVEDCTWTDIGHRGTYLSIYLPIYHLSTYLSPTPSPLYLSKYETTKREKRKERKDSIASQLVSQISNSSQHTLKHTYTHTRGDMQAHMSPSPTPLRSATVANCYFSPAFIREGR